MRKKTDMTVYRALDANLNRAVEGVRVVEDVLRFGYNAGDAAARLRAIRHELRAAAALFTGGGAALIAARDSERDVARNAPALVTGDAMDTIAANLKRAQEAARVLEELSKQSNPAASSKFGEIRFKLYDIEKDAARFIGYEGGPKPMPRPPFLYAIAGYEELRSCGSFRLAKSLATAGTGMIQLRDKTGEDADLLSNALRIGAKLEKSDSLFVVNDRVDIALAACADAVHLGDKDIPVAAARDIAGGKLRIGRSTHSYREAMEILEQSPDYIAFGSIFRSPTKPDRKPVGLKLLERVCAAAGDVPVVAIGGINQKNIKDVFSAGAAGAAVISAVTKSDDLKKTLSQINKIILSFRTAD